MDLNVTIFFYLILALCKKILALVLWKWPCAAQIAPPIVSSVRSSNSHPDLLLITTTRFFKNTLVLNTGLSEPL